MDWFVIVLALVGLAALALRRWRGQAQDYQYRKKQALFTSSGTWNTSARILTC